MADATASSGVAEPDDPSLDSSETMLNKRFVGLLVIAALIGVVTSLAAWAFLELVYVMQQGLFIDLPKELGYNSGAPLWWSLPICAFAGLPVAFAIVRLPGNGGHVPAYGLVTGGLQQPAELPGIMLAAVATIGLGLVLGPEAPLIALGGGLGVLAIRLTAKDAPPQVLAVAAAAGSFAAVSFIFGSPLIAAVILIEAAGIGGDRLRLMLLPGLLAAGVGSLVSSGMGSLTGLSSSHWALGPLSLPDFSRPELGDFAWSILLAAAVALGVFLVLLLAKKAVRLVEQRPFLLIPAAGLIVSVLAIAFAQSTGESANAVLFSGQDALPPLVEKAGVWSASTIALLMLFKGLAWSVALGSFRGGPTFPAMFLGAAAGILASDLPGFGLTAAVAVGLGASVVAMLRLPLSAVVLATLLTSGTGAGATPLIIVGVVVAYLVTLALAKWHPGEPVPSLTPAPSAGP